MKFTLKQLDVFIATARYGTISRAAQELNISQSAASSALKELERHCVAQIFDRIGKRLVLNDLGRAVRSKAESLLKQAQELELDMRQETTAGALKVGATTTIGSYLAVSILTRYKESYPKSTVTLEIANTQKIAKMVANYELDVGMIEGVVDEPDLTYIPWLGDEIKIVCAPHHPYAQKAVLLDTDLIQANWILRERGSAARVAFSSTMKDVLPYMKPPLELQHTEAIKRAVESGLGLGCLSSLTLEVALYRNKMIQLQVPGRNMHRQFFLIVHKDKYRTRSIDRWISLCWG